MHVGGNRSLTAAEAELIRRLNRAVKDSLDWPAYEALVRNGVITAITNGRRPPADEPRMHTPDWALEAVAERAAGQVAAIRSSGATVLGDLDALAARGRSTTPVDALALDRLPADAVVEVQASSVAARTASVRRRDPLDPLRTVRNEVERRVGHQ